MIILRWELISSATFVLGLAYEFWYYSFVAVVVAENSLKKR